MRGFASMLLLLAFCALLMSLAQLEASQQESSSASARAQLALEQAHYAELEFKEAVHFALSSARGKSRQEKTADAALKLASLESFFEDSFSKKGIDVDLWAGIASEQELRELKRDSFASKKALKCLLCFDLREVSSGVLVAQGFVDVAPSGKMLVSRSGASFIPLLAEHSFSSKKFVLGASFYFPASDVSMVSVAEEGFS